MIVKKPTYEEMEARLAEAESAIEALHSEQVDAVVGKEHVFLLRLEETEKKLRESEERYRLFLESTSDSVCALDREWRHLTVNEAAERFAQMSREELLGKKLTDVFPNIEETVFFKTSTRVMETRESGTVTAEYAFPDGRKGWYEVHVDPIPEGILCISRDITERKRTDEQVEAHRRLLETVVNHIPAAVNLIRGNDLRLRLVNPAYQAIAPGKEILGKTLDELWPETGQNFSELCRRVLETGEPYYVEDELNNIRRRADGPLEPAYFSWSLHRVQLPGGEGWGILNTAWETTDRKRMEEELRKSRDELEIRVQERTAELKKTVDILQEEIEERIRAQETINEQADILDSLFKDTITPLVLLDKDFNFIRVNEAYARSCRRDMTEFKGHNHFEFHPNEANEAIFRKVVESKFPYQAIAKPFSFSDHPEWGVTYWDWTLTPLLDEYREVKFLVLSLNDVTERKKAEIALMNSRKQLRNLSVHLQSVREEERTTIAREIHDELGQTLTALKIDLSTLTKKIYPGHKPLLEKTGSMIKRIDETIQTVKKICTELRPTILDHLGISASIEWLAEEFQKTTGIKCEVSFYPEDIVLDQDISIVFFRIFQEALTNIMRHAGATEVKASLTARDSMITLEVKDNGKGITEEEITNPNSFGLLGIRERVNFLGGGVTISGTKNKGTTIELILPFKRKGKG